MNEARIALENPLYNLIRDKFPSLLHKSILGSFQSFF